MAAGIHENHDQFDTHNLAPGMLARPVSASCYIAIRRTLDLTKSGSHRQWSYQNATPADGCVSAANAISPLQSKSVNSFRPRPAVNH